MASTLLFVSLAVTMLLGATRGCFIDTPEVLSRCITFDLYMFIGISKNELGPVCQRAKSYFDCASEYAKNCPAQNTLQGVLKDVGVLIVDCCNPQSGPSNTCPTTEKTTTSSSSAACFPSGTSVLLASGRRKLIEQLEIGDIVKAVSSDGYVVDSEVIMFTDRSEDVVGDYLRLSLRSGHELHVSPLHLVAVLFNQTTIYKQASTISAGDVMLVSTYHERVRPSPVIGVKRLLMRGAFAPTTMEGTLLVDDVTASCYAVVSEHWVGHLAFTPVRALHRVSTSVFSVPAWDRQPQGLHWVASVLWKFADAVMPSLFVS